VARLRKKSRGSDLLTHTGGTGDIFGPQFSARRSSLRTHQDYLDLYGARDLLFEPGSRWLYSNYGFVLLGAIIEKVTGQSCCGCVRDRVYAPAGMASSGSDPEDRPVPNRAIGYMMPGGASGWRANGATLPYRGTAAGGGYTTIGDLLRSRMRSRHTGCRTGNVQRSRRFQDPQAARKGLPCTDTTIS
jgi:D-alanyl-D-alanine carboxypeptidase